MLQIKIREMRFHVRHGVYEFEHKEDALFVVNLTLLLNEDRATFTDDLAHTVDYSAVYEVVRKEMNISSQLIEHVAGRIARSLLSLFSIVSSCTVSVRKCSPPIENASFDGAEVIYELNRN